MTTPALLRVDLDADPVSTAHRTACTAELGGAEREWRSYDGTDVPPEHEELATPPGNGGLDETALEDGRRRLASVLGW
jgi:hypothetical protein